MAAPLEWGGNFGRQGSSTPASWEKTESSPEEHVELRVSGLNSSSTGTPGYGEPPRVKISQSRTPNDQLQTETDGSGYIFCATKNGSHIPQRLD
ncbi:hypothetical protein EYF80_020721 [Liparis tanakae]|uniref:Uncharacterized protein n=1 Tax=Liparis tanakae TaxID=230148 RepID=A0A4Z2HTD6_9TELE|nr:hypothetical protein EYF80_020721 [Liparis tanakae]